MKNSRKKNILLSIKLFSLLLIVFLLLKFYFAQISTNQLLIECDFEKYNFNKDSIVFNTNDTTYNIAAISKSLGETSKSGNNSLKVHHLEYVNLIELNNIGTDEVYKVSLYRKNGSAGIVIQEANSTKPNVYTFQRFTTDSTSDGWSKLEAQIRTPPDYSGNKLKIYIWNPQKELSYFDDLKIEQLEHMTYPEYNKYNSISLFIENIEYNKLKQIRAKAFEKGILVTEDDSYIKTIMASDKKFIEADIRFKGDWLDHLEGDKWSFRIKLNNQSWKNICTFSLHTPSSRSFINEWLIHKIFADNNILTTRYGFIPLRINSRSLGIYAYEEHFEKQLLESSLRREAPIIAFNEDVLWNRRSIQLSTKEDFIFNSASIKPFQTNKILNNSELYKTFIIAQNLLDSYKNGKLNCSDVFDIKQTAKYFAIQSVYGGYHGVIWHNIRFYYNPVTCRLEPIAFDCFANYGIANWGFTNIIGNYNPNINNQLPTFAPFYIDLITNSDFIKEYIIQLKYFSDDKNVSYYLNKYQIQISDYEKLLQKEFLNYKFDPNTFYEHANLIKAELKAFETNINQTSYVDSLKNKSVKIRQKYNYDQNIKFFSDYVTFYKNSTNSIQISVSHSNNIEIIGFGNKNNIKEYSSYQILNKNSTNVYNDIISIDNSFSDYKYIYFKNPLFDTVYNSKIIPYPAPTTYNPRNDIAKNATDISKYINHDKKEVHFSGNISFNNHIYTPIGYTVIFDEGTNIDITNNAAFIINSNVIAEGTKENPIKIYSSDKTANGFTILQAESKSILKNVCFDNLNTLNYMGWALTGAVTFYEADVEFYDCNFTNNHCEDMLNTIRSNFYLENCIIENTFGDSHDSDFCTGTLYNCTFNNNGNDAIDFSTSDAIINNCKINGAVDKGISVGENTKAKIINLTISDVNIGIASKDLSHADVDKCIINNATYGFLILQKKPEFGPATITANNCSLNEVWTESLIEKNSILILNGKTIKGKKNKLKALFYE